MQKILCTTFLSLTLSLTAFNGLAMPSEEKTTTLQDQKQVKITIYNENLALIKDLRHVSLDKGINRLAWREVSAQMRPETALLRIPAQPAGFRLLEQNFDFDLLTPDGQPVRWALNALHGVKLPDRVYGPTLTLKVCEAAAQEGLPLYLYGSTPEVLAGFLRLAEEAPRELTTIVNVLPAAMRRVGRVRRRTAACR